MSSKRAHGTPRSGSPEAWTVINDVPDPTPVMKGEVDALETYFSDVIDACLRPLKHDDNGVGDV